MKTIPDIVTLLLLIVLMAVPNGFVIMKLWGWFVCPLGAPTIGVMQAAGIYTLIHVMTYTPPNPDGKKLTWDNTLARVARRIGLLALFLGLGYVIHVLS